MKKITLTQAREYVAMKHGYRDFKHYKKTLISNATGHICIEDMMDEAMLYYASQFEKINQVIGGGYKFYQFANVLVQIPRTTNTTKKKFILRTSKRTK